MKKSSASLWFVIALTLLPSTLPAQSRMRRDTSIVAQMTLFGRAHEFERAASLGRAYVAAHRSGATTPEHCMVLAALAYDEWALDRPEPARASIADFDRRCQRVLLEKGYRNAIAAVREYVATRQSAATVIKPLPAAASTGPVAPSASAPVGAKSLSIGPLRSVGDGLVPVVDPATAGLNVDALDRHRLLCERSGADACLIVHKGRIVQEWYGPKYRAPMTAMSSTKSIAGLLVGMLVADGKIASIDRRVCEFLSDWCTGLRGRVTLRHLLAMTSGLPNLPDGRGVGYARDKNAFARALTPDSMPGTSWAYSNEGVQLLSPILDKAAGEPIQDYAQRRLFTPLGMRDTRLKVDEKGHAWTYADLQTTPRDFARLGMLMAQRGMWNGTRIVPAQWITESVRPSQPYQPEYGLLWWTAMPHEARYAATGYLDTDMQVMPDAGLVIVRMQARFMSGAVPYKPEAFDLFNAFVRPAIR